MICAAFRATEADRHRWVMLAATGPSCTSMFGAAIEKHLQAHVSRTSLELKVQGIEIFRPYSNEIKFLGTSDHTLRIKDIEYIEFPDVDGAPGAVRLPVADFPIFPSLPRFL
jgi:hypothetical protein